MIRCEKFKTPWELTEYCNKCGIAKKDIIQITHTETVYGYSGYNTYTLFYEVRRAV